MKRTVTILFFLSLFFYAASQNDKSAIPAGYGEHQYLEPGTDITYTIRFQNNGENLAYNLKIKDTLSVHLDAGTARPGPSSHPYELEVTDYNGVELFFPGIQLPSSSVDELGSHGFVSFTVSQAEDVPLGTVIRNRAAIFFDFNSPVVTNEYFHTIEADFMPVATVKVFRPGLELNVYPNPVSNTAIFDLQEAEFHEGHLVVLDQSGRAVTERSFRQARFEFERKDLSAGNYFFRVSLDGAQVAAGQIALQ